MIVAAPVLVALGVMLFVYERSDRSYSEWGGLKNLGNEAINMIHSSHL